MCVPLTLPGRHPVATSLPCAGVLCHLPPWGQAIFSLPSPHLLQESGFPLYCVCAQDLGFPCTGVQAEPSPLVACPASLLPETGLSPRRQHPSPLELALPVAHCLRVSLPRCAPLLVSDASQPSRVRWSPNQVQTSSPAVPTATKLRARSSAEVPFPVAPSIMWSLSEKGHRKGGSELNRQRGNEHHKPRTKASGAGGRAR